MTEEQLQELEAFAGLFFSFQELEVLMGMEEGSLAQEVESRSPIGMAVARGRLKSEGAIRKGILELAKGGSGPAQQTAIDFIKSMQVMDAE